MAAGEATGLRGEAPAPASLGTPAAGAVAVALAAVALYLDAVTPFGFGAGLLFILSFLVVAFDLPRVPPLAAAGAAILLSAGGLLVSAPAIPVALFAGPAGVWVLSAGVPAALALAARAGSWLLIAGLAVVLEEHRSRGREQATGDRYRVRFREHDAAVLVMDPADGRIVDANPAAARLFWSSPADLRTMRVTDLNGSPTGSAGARLLALTGAQRGPVRFAFRHASGETRYIEVCSVPVTVEGRPLLYAAVYDLTEEHRAGTAVRESEARHRAFVDALPGAMVLLEASAGPGGEAEDFRVLDLNAAGADLFGRPREEAVGRALRELAGGSLPPWFELLVRVARSGRPEHCPAAPTPGGVRALRAVRAAPGRVAALFLDPDAGERVHGEDAPGAPYDDLERFARVAGSDLLEPIWTIAAFAELLEHRAGERLDRESGEMLAYVLTSARRMEQVVQELLRDVRVSTRRIVLEPVDLGRALAVVEAELAGRPGKAGATVTHDPLPAVLGDRALLEQALGALIGTVLRVQRAERPRIHVSAAREGDRWRIRVAGGGTGPSAGVLDGVAGPRAPYDCDGYEGGLPTVRRIVERLGGSLRVEPGEGRGAVFSFTVPAVDGEPARSGR